jgi:hypothetical protein
LRVALEHFLEALVNERYFGGQDFLAAWNTPSGQMRLNFPARTNDLQFLTGPSVADIDGDGFENRIVLTSHSSVG